MILLGALIGLAYFKICTLSFKFLSILLAYTFISESIATYMRHINKNPTFLMALYTPIHVIFITLIYYILLKISKSKFVIAFIGIGFFSFAILKTINYRNYQLPTQLIMADCIMVVFFAILLYYDLIKNHSYIFCIRKYILFFIGNTSY